MSYLFSFQHNWSSSFKVDHSYKTEIIVSRAKREQRFALRSQPKKQLSLSVSPTGLQLRSFLSQMAARQQSEWVVADVTRPVLTITSKVGPSNNVDFSLPHPVWLMVGAYCVLETSGVFSMHQILSITGTNVLFSSSFTQSLPIGSKVYPGISGRFDNSIKGTLFTNTAATIPLKLAADPGLNRVENTVAAPVTFNGRELFLRKPNWQQAPSISTESFLETIDYDRGRVAHNEPVIWNAETLRLSYLGRDQSDVELITQFFHRMKGQQGEFYMPTWTDDFDLTTGAASGAFTLNVPTTTMYDLCRLSPVYKAAIIFYRDGTYQVNRLTDITLNSGASRFTFVSNFTQAINDTTVKLMCWLPAWRLSIDTLTIEWVTRKVAQTQLTMQTVEDLA